MPAHVRWRSTAVAYDCGGADSGTTRARGTRNAPPDSGKAPRSIAPGRGPVGGDQRQLSPTHTAPQERFTIVRCVA